MRPEEICNFCELKALRKEAKAIGGRVVVAKNNAIGGVNIYLVPKGERPDVRTPADGGKHWRFWFQSLSEECTCK